MASNCTDLIPVEELKSLFCYEPETGHLYWTMGIGRPKNRPAGTKHDQGYTRVRINGRYYYSHRIIWALHTGSWPEHEIDHINGDPSDNRIENLRAATRLQNGKNTAIGTANKSGAKGVYYDKERAKWVARIMADRQRTHLGSFENFDDAVAARRVAEEKHFGDWKRGNTCA